MAGKFGNCMKQKIGKTRKDSYSQSEKDLKDSVRELRFCMLSNGDNTEGFIWGL